MSKLFKAQNPIMCQTGQTPGFQKYFYKLNDKINKVLGFQSRYTNSIKPTSDVFFKPDAHLIYFSILILNKGVFGYFSNLELVIYNHFFYKWVHTGLCFIISTPRSIVHNITITVIVIHKVTSVAESPSTSS
ncbi:hypothetical protein Hanom_Chr06g00547571 [Helianthus anomalus]